MEQSLPLAGLKVVELATVVAGPAAARILAGYGAEVIKIETPVKGDLLRPYGQGHYLPTEPDNNPLFDVYNTGKKLITVNLKSPGGQEIFHRLIKDADIFLTNVRMPSLVRMGIGYEALKEKYPRLIYAHLSGYGLEGPDMNSPGFDMTAFWARSGASLDWEVPGSFPIRPAFGFGDTVTAAHFLSGILMAVYARNNTGHGTLVSSSLLGAGIWSNSSYILNSQPQYGRQFPVDRYLAWDPFSDYYQCSTGEWITFIAKSYPADRPTFARIFNLPMLMEDPDCDTLEKIHRSGKDKVVSKKLEDYFRTKTYDEWVQILTENDVAFSRLRHFKEVSTDEQAWANGSFAEAAYPDGAKTAIPMPPINFSEYDRRPFVQTGGIGADNEEVLHSLGYDDAAIAQLRESGAL